MKIYLIIYLIIGLVHGIIEVIANLLLGTFKSLGKKYWIDIVLGLFGAIILWPIAIIYGIRLAKKIEESE